VKKRIVYILSTNFAGSHYLSLLLGSNSRALHAGELFHFGRPVGKCNLKEVNLKDSEVFEGIGPHNIEQVYDIIFSRIDARIEVVVNTSKTIRGWAERFLGNESYDRLYIHLFRDPRALVCRWLLNRELKTELRYRWKLLRSWPRLRPFAEWSPMPAVWMCRWLLQNRAITDFIGRHGLPATLVTYRDLAKETEAEVRRLTEWMGLTYEPRQLEYWSREHIGRRKEATSGSRNRRPTTSICAGKPSWRQSGRRIFAAIGW